jgi:hypothetical protein
VVNGEACRVFSLSSSGGEGWGEEAVSLKVGTRFMGRMPHTGVPPV